MTARTRRHVRRSHDGALLAGACLLVLALMVAGVVWRG